MAVFGPIRTPTMNSVIFPIYTQNGPQYASRQNIYTYGVFKPFPNFTLQSTGRILSKRSRP